MKEDVCLAMKCSRNSTCSIIVLCVNHPSAVMSRHRSTSMSRLVQKRCKIMPSDNDKSGLAYINVENRAQAAPIDSFSRCSKSRIALGREPIRDMRKMQDRTYLYVHPSPHSYFLWQMCTIVLPSLWEREETISTLEFLLSCPRCSGTNIFARILVCHGRGFCYHALRRVVLEP